MSKIHEIFNIKNDDNLLDKESPLINDEKSRILNMIIKKIPPQKNKKFSKRKVILMVVLEKYLMWMK